MSRLFLVKISYLIISLSLIAGCSNELVVETEESRLPVVYGLLDAADSLQLIRIEAALLPVNHGGPDAYLLDSLHRNTQFFEADFGDIFVERLRNELESHTGTRNITITGVDIDDGVMQLTGTIGQ